MKNHYNNNKKYYHEKSKKNKIKEIAKYDDYKNKLNCSDCNMSFKDRPYLCDFHHIDMDNKHKDPAYFRNHFKSFLKEIEGCIPLCSNCHRIRHNKHNCKQRENLPG